jgi:transcription initiation factor IIE alpha subunit
MSDCSVNCLENPDAVDKTNWNCNVCGTNLEQAHKDKQKRIAEFNKNIKNIESKAKKNAEDAYHKVFSDSMKFEAMEK